VGPKKGEGKEDEKLKSAVVNSLELTEQYQIQSIAFPAISTGIFGFPRDRCAEIMLSETVNYLRGQTGLQKVVFCLFDRASYRIFEQKLNQIVHD
jgi:O-acetyl-ADP-ribose deacetylase (regulator of RNase III)